MDKKITNILTGSKSKVTVNTNTFTNVQFNSSQRLLPPDELNRVLDINEQFNTERQSCTYYRILGKINPLVSNALFNTTLNYNNGSNDSLEKFKLQEFVNQPISSTVSGITYAESIKKNLKEIDGWYGYFDPDLSKKALCSFIDMEPKRQRFSFIPDTTNITNEQVKNWELTITYPYSADTTHYLVNNGLLIVESGPAIVGGKEMIIFYLPVRHNLIPTNTVRISGTSVDGIYEVKRLGNDNGNLKEYSFCLDISATTVQIGTESRMNKLYDSVPSEYYFRKFKKIKTRATDVIETDDYEIYNLAFSETLFADNLTQFIFNEDIDVSNLTDNLNRPLSQLYLTVIKKDSNAIFTDVKSGIESPFIDNLNLTNVYPNLLNLPIIQKIHGAKTSNIKSFKALEENVLVGNDDFYGDLVEYNKMTQAEFILSDVFYRFNTVNRETTSSVLVNGPRPEGYYYKPHNEIAIRQFSTYIEVGDNNTVGIPDYATNLDDGRYLWRDLLPIGFIDLTQIKLDYPFTNGCHYLYNNFIFDVKRQDPFGAWEMYYSNFPADPIGNILEKQFNVNSVEDVC